MAPQKPQQKENTRKRSFFGIFFSTASTKTPIPLTARITSDSLQVSIGNKPNTNRRGAMSLAEGDPLPDDEAVALSAWGTSNVVGVPAPL